MSDALTTGAVATSLTACQEAALFTWSTMSMSDLLINQGVRLASLGISGTEIRPETLRRLDASQ